MMPIYTFKCPSCQKEEDVTQSMNAPVPICQRCADSSCGVHIVEMKKGNIDKAREIQKKNLQTRQLLQMSK